MTAGPAPEPLPGLETLRINKNSRTRHGLSVNYRIKRETVPRSPPAPGGRAAAARAGPTSPPRPWDTRRALTDTSRSPSRRSPIAVPHSPAPRELHFGLAAKFPAAAAAGGTAARGAQGRRREGRRSRGNSRIPSNALALAAALLQLLDPLNAKLSVFLPKPGRVCEGSGRMAASHPLPRQQGGANLKESTKAPFPSAAELPAGTEHGRHRCPSGKPQPRGWVRLTHIFFIIIYLKKKRIQLKMLQLILLISSAFPPVSPPQYEVIQLLSASSPAWGCPGPRCSQLLRNVRSIFGPLRPRRQLNTNKHRQV